MLLQWLCNGSAQAIQLQHGDSVIPDVLLDQEAEGKVFVPTFLPHGRWSQFQTLLSFYNSTWNSRRDLEVDMNKYDMMNKMVVVIG